MILKMEMHMHGIRATPGSPSATLHAAPLRICVGTCPPQPASHTQRYVSSGEHMRACAFAGMYKLRAGMTICA